MYAILVCFFLSKVSYGSHFKDDTPFQVHQNVPVGTKVSDSSATVSISSSQIQQSIIPAIRSLLSATVTGSGISILTGQRNYLMFTVVHNSDTLSVAVELIEQSGSLSFNATKSLGIHVCKKAGSCSDCLYVRNKQDRIIGCSCSAVPQSENWECNHKYEKSKNQ
jgi:hypothetical protein